MNTTVAGHEIELNDTGPGEHITDVIILMRGVRYNDEGGMEDALIIGNTRHTTSMIQRGILDAAWQATTGREED